MNDLDIMLRGSEGYAAALIGVPYDEGSSFLRGPADAPPLIRDALYSYSTNLSAESGIDLGSSRALFEAGDLHPGPRQEIFETIEDAARRTVERGLAPVFLGGDHSITWPAVRGLHERYPDLNILQFDAHPDLYNDLEGNRESHACPFARIMEEGLAERLVQVGIRTMNGHQAEQADRFGVESVEMRNIGEASGLVFDGPLYISFDIDALDPAFAPGVSHYEPGGLSTREAIAIIQGILAPSIVGADMVEYNPSRDPGGVTAFTCAKIIKEIVSKMIDARERGDVR